MAVFEMVKYHAQSYPDDIPLHIEECAAHFDTDAVTSSLKCSLHTEYSFGRRKLNTSLIQQFPAILAAQKDGVPQLWKDEGWALEFAEFVCALAAENDPAVIEVHPPFNDYTDWNGFIKNYSVFEDHVLSCYPDVCMLIENRCGSLYHGGRFLISKAGEVETLCDLIVQHDLALKVAYDIPQIYTAHNAKMQSQFIDLLSRAESIRGQIGGVHLWGKRRSESGRKVAHCGDLTSYFENDMETKNLFLREFSRVFDDGVSRKMVLEVNSGNDDLRTIISDLQEIGVVFA